MGQYHIHCVIAFFFPLLFFHFIFPFSTTYFSSPPPIIFSFLPSFFYALLPPLISYFPNVSSSYSLSPLSLLLLSSSFYSIILPSFYLSFFLSHGTHTFYSISRYYAICCQPLVYRNKMTPLRIALMLGGCWVIPMFISFLPIMQGWNNIGIIDLVSTHWFAL